MKKPYINIANSIGQISWISNAFDAVEDDLDDIKSSIDEIKSSIRKLEQQVNHNHNQLSAKLEIILEHITGISDLPEE